MNSKQAKLNKEIGFRIRGQREFLGYTREELSEMADISTQFLADIEVGRKSMTALTIINLSKSLSVSADYILFGSTSDVNCLPLPDLSDGDEKISFPSTLIEFEHSLTRTFRSMSDTERKGGLDILLAYAKTLNELDNNKS